MISLVKRIIQKRQLVNLVNRGLKVGKTFQVMGNLRIDYSHCWHIEIGDSVTLAPNVHILAHDASTKMFLDYTKVKNVKIGNNVFIGANSVVLPGSIIGDNVIIGANSVVTGHLSGNNVYAGNIAKKIISMDEYLTKNRKCMSKNNCFDKSFRSSPSLSQDQKNILIKEAKESHTIYIK